MELNRIYNEDCIDFMSNMKDNSVDLIIADPPYFGIINEEWDNQWKSLSEYVVWISQVFNEFARILKQNRACYVWSSITNYPYIQLELNKYLDYASTITWKKQRGRGNGWGFNREEICVNTKGYHVFNKVESQTLNLPHLRSGTVDYSGGKRRIRQRDYKLASSIWDDIPQVCSYRKQLHPTEKPVECSRRILLASSKEQDLVYIPFCGSGSEIEASIKLNRNWIATEISSLYILTAEERINNE